MEIIIFIATSMALFGLHVGFLWAMVSFVRDGAIWMFLTWGSVSAGILLVLDAGLLHIATL